MEIKYLLLALPLLLVGCTKPANPKFHYNDCLSVDDPFYGRTYGRTTDFNSFGYTYTVERRIGNQIKEYVISENLLTKVDDSYCSDTK